MSYKTRFSPITVIQIPSQKFSNMLWWTSWSELSIYGDFTRGREWLLKNVPIFFYRKIKTSINISIEGLHPPFRYQLRVSRGPHNTILGHALVELVQTLGELGQICQIRQRKKLFLHSDFTPFYEQKFSNMRPLLSITFAWISKKFGHCTLGSGGKKTFKRCEQLKKISQKLFATAILGRFLANMFKYETTS